MSDCRCSTPARPTPAERQHARYLARKAERTEVDGRMVHPRARHGTTGGHSNYSCRCAPCCKAWTEYVVDRRKARLALRKLVDGRLIAPNVVHGKLSTRTNHGCECQPCMNTARVDRRRELISA